MRRRSAYLVLLGSLLAAAAISPPAMAGFSLPYRYAGPNGTGTTCTSAAPCSILTAINDAPHGNVVVIKPGNYGSPADPILDSLKDTNGALDIFGLTGSKAPVIYDSAAYAIDLTNLSELGHVTLITSAADAGVLDIGGSVDNVAVYSTSSHFGACAIFGILTNSVCSTTGADDPAVGTEGSGHYDVIMRGVTAEATGAGGVGLLVDAGDATTEATLHVTNTIIHGTTTDVSVVADAVGATASLTIKNSDYKTAVSTGTGTASIHSNSSDISAAPKFVDPAHAKFAEKVGSPTIDTAGPVPAGETDLLGNPRPLGSKPDMGAYEFLEKPTATHLTSPKPGKHVAHLTVKVNPEGLATKVRLVARLGHRHKSSHAVSAGKGRHGTTIHLVMHGLKSGSTYKVQAIATNKAGRTTSAAKQVKTKK